MICRLCLKDILEVINIFDEIGTELSVATILKKYFWFEPKLDDPISTAICNTCWVSVTNFHEYYLSVEEAHRLLAERYFVKPASPLGEDFIDKEDKSGMKEEETEQIHPHGQNDLNWDLHQITYIPYQLEIDEEEETSEEKPDHVIEFMYDGSNEHITEDKKVLDEDIKPISDVQLDRNDRQLSLRSRTLSMATSTPESKVIPKRKKSAKLKNERKPPADKVIDKKESKYNMRAKEYDLLIAKHMKLTCEICHTTLADFTSLRQHYWNVHEQKGYVTCCNKKLFKRVLLFDHINKHLDPEYFKCHDCNKSFADKQCLKNHMLIIHQSDEEKPFQCEHCAKRFIKQYLLDQHQTMHVPMDERKFSCDFCPKVFPSENTLNTHRKNSHTHEYGKMCHICAKVIRGKAMFEKHQMEHAGVKQPEVQCEKCGSWLKNKHSLQKHLRRHNEEGKLHTCNICGKVAPNQSALRSHFRYVHASERTYACSVCDKAFKKALTLKEHMTTHTGEVLYSCPHCPKTFNSNANMHSHRKKVHPMEWEAARKHRKGKVVSGSSTQQGNDSGNDTAEDGKYIAEETDVNEMPDNTKWVGE